MKNQTSQNEFQSPILTFKSRFKLQTYKTHRKTLKPLKTILCPLFSCGAGTTLCLPGQRKRCQRAQYQPGQIRFLIKKQKLKNKKFTNYPKIKILNLNQNLKCKKMKMTQSNVFVVLTFAPLLSKLLQRKPKQEQLTISKTKILASKIQHTILYIHKVCALRGCRQCRPKP